MKQIIPNILASRYATPEMVYIWSMENKVKLERQFWIAALKAQRDWGIEIAPEAIEAYESVAHIIDLESISHREEKLRHDVLARIEEFNELAGYQLIHDPFTSRDVTDNTEQAQIYESLKLVRARSMAVLHRFAKRARQYANLEMVGRSHNVPAQTITLGKRFANWGEEFLCAFWKLENLLDNTTFRGIKGPMGTQQDLINKMGDLETALGFEQTMQDLLHLPRQVFDSVGQVYPRSLDFEVISLLAQLSSAPGNMAITIRLMAGAGLATEGFAKSQKGSAAMPHKMNPRTSERIDGMVDVIGGYVCMAQALLGNQWNEGDVSCSIVRRVALPDSFFAIDGLLQATMIVLDEMGVYEKAIAKELKTALPFLSTTNILRAFQDKGMGREDAHTMIRNSAIDAIQAGEPETFITRLLANEGMPLSADEVYAQITEPNHGATLEQIEGVCLMIDNIIAEHREVLEYKPEPIL